MPIEMNSFVPGTTTSQPDVTNVSAHGFWLLTEGKEYFLSYEDFPWFKDAPIGDVVAVEEIARRHFHWPKLDIDLSLEIIENPENFPLVSRKPR